MKTKPYSQRFRHGEKVLVSTYLTRSEVTRLTKLSRGNRAAFIRGLILRELKRHERQEGGGEGQGENEIHG